MLFSSYLMQGKPYPLIRQWTRRVSKSYYEVTYEVVAGLCPLSYHELSSTLETHKNRCLSWAKNLALL